ncbi:MAG TPA: hypothetical protein VKE70_18800 [Candidatus Solibacter sp.]|nr:hypothetical protein [Candidatus Solibacter sp.]
MTLEEAPRQQQVAELNGDVISPTPDFCVSPDGRTWLHSRLEIATSQIRMIEGL